MPEGEDASLRENNDDNSGNKSYEFDTMLTVRVRNPRIAFHKEST